MRTTLEIDDDLLHAAKELARREGKTAGEMVSQLLRRALTRADAGGATAKAVAGFQPFAAKPGVMATLDQVNALRDAEGV
ncbi:MAG TPA: CopG family transcriptional regulator [Burkholderiaceae bacterium]|jgi:Arc/MetJ family transcription regulator